MPPASRGLGGPLLSRMEHEEEPRRLEDTKSEKAQIAPSGISSPIRNRLFFVSSSLRGSILRDASRSLNR